MSNNQEVSLESVPRLDPVDTPRVRRLQKTDDPQLTVQGQVKRSRSSDSEVIVFEIPLVFFRMVCIVPIPDEGTDQAPVYVKFKVNHRAG